MKSRFSSIAKRTKSSIIRELLKLINKPGIISFAGGLPAPETFPVNIIQNIINDILKINCNVALQYGATSGIEEFRNELSKMLIEQEALNICADNIIVTTSSQQALDLIARTFLDCGDTVIMELPSYIGAIQVFESYGANMIGVRSDNEGMSAKELEVVLKKYHKKCKFIYLVPDFQNPSGLTMSLQRRHDIILLAKKYEVLIVEDSPYRQLRFEGQAPQMLYKLSDLDNVISLFSFSKTFVPGLRLGYIVAPQEIIKSLITIKQSLDLCTSSFNQLIALEFIRRGYFNNHIEFIVDKYRKKRDVMLNALQEFMPKSNELSWTKPEGGLFLWVILPEYIDADKMFYHAIDENVAYVVGSAFHCDGSGKNTFRMNFSYSSESQIQEGIRRLAKVISNNLKNEK